MEHEVPKDMNPSTNAPIYYGPSNNGTDSALLAGLATKNYDYPGMIGADGICDLRESVKDSSAHIRADVAREGQEAVGATKDAACDILNKLGSVECAIIKATGDQTLYLTNSLTAIREQGIRAEYEAKLTGERVIKEINDKAQYNTDRTQDKLQASKDFNAEKFCALEKQLLKCCCEQEVAAANIQSGINQLLNDGPGNN